MKRRDFLSIGAAGVAAAWLPQGALAQIEDYRRGESV